MYEYRVLQIEKVVDGDTVDIVIDLGFSLTKKERVRLSGIDTPETRTKDLEEKELGMDAKNFLTRRLDDAVGYNLVVKTEKDGKYGRMLGEFHIGDINLNEEMYDRGYAWRYDGGTKKKDLVDLKIKRGLIKEV